MESVLLELMAKLPLILEGPEFHHRFFIWSWALEDNGECIRFRGRILVCSTKMQTLPANGKILEKLHDGMAVE